MADKIYKVTIAGQPHARLVKADNRVQAVNFVARGAMTATLATQDDLVELVGKNVPVETAVEPQAQLPV